MDIVKIISITPSFIEEHIIQFLDIISDSEHEYWGKEEFLYDLPNKWNSSIALVKQTVIIGFIISSLKQNTFHIHKFFIHKDYRSCGYGEMLLKEFERKIMQDFSVHSISLKVYFDNSKAIAFYKKNGFVKTTKEQTLQVLKKEI